MIKKPWNNILYNLALKNEFVQTLLTVAEGEPNKQESKVACIPRVVSLSLMLPTSVWRKYYYMSCMPMQPPQDERNVITHRMC